MGLLQDVGNALIDLSDSASSGGGAVDEFAEGVSSVMNEGAEAVAGLLEAVGTAVESTAEGAASSFGDDSPGARWGAALLRWSSRAVSAGFQSLALGVRGIVSAFADGIAGTIRILGGILTLNPALILKGIGNILAGVAGAALAVGGSILALLQAIFMGTHARPLTPEEAAVVTRVYRGSLDPRRIRIVAGDAGVFTTSQPQYPEEPARPFTLGNRIYMQRVEARRWMTVLVHECGHVWQNRHVGTRYLAEALWAQGIHYIADKSAYDWADELARGKTRWQDFNREAQAEFVESVWVTGRRRSVNPGKAGDFFGDEPLADDVDFRSDDLTAFARDSVTYVRSR